MQPVRFTVDVVNTVGATGYSCLITKSNNRVERTTVLLLRDNNGSCMWALIVPSETLKGAM